MKNGFIFKISALALVLVMGSCKDLLDLQPQTALSQSTGFTTPERIELVISGTYDAAQSGFYAGGAIRGYPFGAAHVAQGDNRGEDVVNTQAFYLITYSNTYDGVSANNDYMFQTLFSLINRANVSLQGLETAVPSSALTQAQIDAYKGECRFLRALAYHELLKHYCRPFSDNPTAATGGMPYRLTAVTDAVTAASELEHSRESVQSNYTNILADLDFAESVLPNTRASANLKITRATKAAAVALKTRIYLHMGNWAKVVEEGNKLAPQSAAPFTPDAAYGTYSLTANPYGPFSSSGSKSNTESIFSIDNDVTDNPGVNGSLPQVYNTTAAGTVGRALVAISPIIWNQTWFNATDTRKSATFVSTNESTTAGGKGGYFTKKYTDVAGQSDNAPVIRYAEVLLNMAEAIQRQSGGPDPRAFALYYAVRGRSNAAGTDVNYDQVSDFATADALTQAILNERRIEFICEGQRWGDIHRLAQDAKFNSWGGGIPPKINGGIGNLKPTYTGLPATTDALMAPAAATRQDGRPYSDFKFVWPIPSSETTLNPTLAAQQNPGW